jgi:H+/Cl- antiporter ClcA
VRQPNAPAAALVSTSPRFWAAVVGTGVGAGLIGIVVTGLLHLVQHAAYDYHIGSFLEASTAASPERRLVVLTLAGLVAGLGWWALRGVYGRITGVSEAAWRPGGRMRLLPTTLDGVLQIVVVALGASLGREGAPRQIAAALGSRLGELTGLDDGERRLLIACGAGAGLAAVYNVPFGGALFTLEIMLGSLRLGLIVPAVATSVLATATAAVVLGDQPVYAVAPTGSSPSLLVFALLAGPVLGLGAAGFVRLVGLAQRHRPTGWRLPVTTTVVFAALGAVSMVLPQVLGNGRGPAQLSLDGLALVTAAVLLALKPLATAGCLASGASGGLFTPTLATGALFGATLGGLWSLVWPTATPTAYALVGATAFLAAALQAPLAAVVLVLELTGTGPALLVPTLVALVGAVVVARLLTDRSTYTVTLAGPGEADSPGRVAEREPEREPGRERALVPDVGLVPDQTNGRWPADVGPGTTPWPLAPRTRQGRRDRT